MIVNWNINGNAWSLEASLEESDVFGTLSRDWEYEPITFRAYILKKNKVLTSKHDVSLIELMNWVEEELKFRMNHD